jgi:hypothetical protein
MIKKYVGMLVASGLAGAVALACTITTGNGVTVPSEDAGTPKLDSGKVDSGKVVTADSGTGESDAGPACYKEKDAKVYVATAKAVGLQGKCTPAAAAAYITACFAPGTDATCMAWGMANEACGACIEGTNTTIGALIPIAGDNIILNGIACSYLTAGLPDCATKGSSAVRCFRTACNTCTGAEEDKACIAAATTGTGVCVPTLPDAACEAALAAKQADVDLKCKAPVKSFEADAALVIAAICGS